MRKVLFSLIAILCLAMPCIAFFPTSEDVAWCGVVSHDLRIISSDFSLIATAADAFDLEAIKKYCDLLVEDAETALENNQEYSVSPELQKAKDYYEQALISYKMGAEKAGRGCISMDNNLIQEGIELTRKGKEYTELATREINNLLP